VSEEERRRFAAPPAEGWMRGIDLGLLDPSDPDERRLLIEAEHPELHEALVRLFRERGFAGCTVLRGIMGFGASAKIHTLDILRLSLDLPLVVEVVDTEDAIQRLLPELDAMIGGGLITLERVRVILYRPADVPETERWRHRIEGLAPER
jgi:uncharacterized protein